MRILLLNQCFYPDVVSTAQHLTDLAKGLSERGHAVTVVTSDRGYDNPANRYPRREVWKNVQIIRVRSLALGKQTKLRRAIHFASFLLFCSLRLMTLPRFDVVVALTSPPLISLLAALLVSIKGGRFCSWIMDLNPDEAVAAGWLREESLVARILQRLLAYSLKRADSVVVLDRFMRDRVLEKGIASERVTIVPPWSHDDEVRYSESGRQSFRCQHGLTEHFVVMYSGNHSPCHPLDTLLNAAQALSSQKEFVFCFVGGGSEYTKVCEFASRNKLENIVCLPYQPLATLSDSLSAADLHVVVMGDKFPGIVHPCKIYNILKVDAPLLYIGPPESHITDIAAQAMPDQMLLAGHDDVTTVVQHIKTAFQRRPYEFSKEFSFSKARLLPQVIKLIEVESTLEVTLYQSGGRPPHSTSPDTDSKAQEVVSL